MAEGLDSKRWYRCKDTQETQVKNRDITGGLPRVAALFEARKPNGRCWQQLVDTFDWAKKQNGIVLEVYPMLEACFVDAKELARWQQYVEVIKVNGASLRPGQVFRLKHLKKPSRGSWVWRDTNDM